MIRWSLINVAAVLAYVATGMPSLWLAVPPVNVSPVWLPAGVALTLVLLYGNRSLPGIFVGACLVHMSAFGDIDRQTLQVASLLGLGTSAGSTLQAWLGGWLIGKTVSRPLTLMRERDVLLFMLLGGLGACLVSPTFGLLSLWASGVLTADTAAVTWGTWWVGDSIGVLIVTPILLTLLGSPAHFWRPRRTTLAGPLLVTLSLVVGFDYYATVQVHARVSSQFHREAQDAVAILRSELYEIHDDLRLTGALLLSSENVTQTEFTRFTDNFGHIQSLSGVYWFDRHAPDGSPTLSAQLEHDDCQSTPPPISSLRNAAQGEDFSTLSVAGDCVIMFAFHSVIDQHSTPAATIGATAIAVNMRRLIKRRLAPHLPAESTLSIDVYSPGGPPVALLHSRNKARTYQLATALVPHFATSIPFDDTRLDIRIEASNVYVARQYGWEAWAILFGCLAFSTLLGIGLLILTGRHARTEQLVHERTAALAAEVEERRLAERLLELQNAVLELVARDEPLHKTLTFLCELVEAASKPGTYASVMQYDAKGGFLRLSAGPSLPEPVTEILQTFPVGEGEGSCGTAAQRRDPVICEDIAVAPEWAKYRDIAKAFGLKACWSTPFYSKSGDILGTFALTHTHARRPDPQDRRYLRSAAFLSSLAVEQALAQANIRQLSLALEQSPSAVAMTNLQGQIEYANPRFSDLTQFDRERSYGQTLTELLRAVPENSNMSEIWQDALKGREWRGTVQNQRADGSGYWAQYHVSPMRNEAGAISHVLVIHEDITALRESNAKIVYQATHDLLTGLLNRAEFESNLERCLRSARRYNEQHALCFIDLDQFKIVNDSSGHAAGDELLRQLSSLMRHHIRETDVLARVGGDEFAILLEHCSLDEARANINKLRQLVADHLFTWHQRSYNVGLSAGLVIINAQSPNADELLREVDAACYTAKETGRDRVQIYSPDDETTTRRSNEVRWVTQLRSAVAEDRLILFQQRIEYLQPGGPLYSMEILLRLRSPDDELIAPGQFLPAAERFGLAPLIDAWVTEHTLDALYRYPTLLENLDYCSINLSALSLNEQFAHQVLEWLDRYRVPPAQICFEITETAAIANLTLATEFINTLRQRGVRFALDDFGSGLSSFAYLKNLPVDILKIDGQFVRDMLGDPIDLAMVEAINGIGKVMGKNTVAEFVEHVDMLEKLRTLAVDAVQGYAVAKPAPLEELL